MDCFKYWNVVEKRLNSLTSPESLQGLAFLEKVFKELGNPAKFPAIHIAGTNGKGSTAACLDSMLRAAGYKTALYTSPHLTYLGERLLINGQMLSGEKWLAALEQVAQVLRKCPSFRLGYFQVLTAAAFWLITQERVDAAVIEAGIGGLRDATNMLNSPLLSVITPLGMDHMHLLGNSLREIALHKFGIIKPGSRALYCGGDACLNEQFRLSCAALNAWGENFSERCLITEVQSSLEGNYFTYKSPQGTRRCFVRLAGLHQPKNASLALRALEIISDKLPCDAGSIEKGLSEVSWPGRMEVMHRAPDVILDGAHNPHGSAALIRSLKALYGDRPLSFVYTSMADKNYAASLELYARAFPQARLFCVELEGSRRCEHADVLARTASAFSWSNKPQAVKNPLEALRIAMKLGNPVILCGSLYFIGMARKWIKDDECLRIL